MCRSPTPGAWSRTNSPRTPRGSLQRLFALAATVDNDESIGPLRVFNTSIPVALYTEFVERVSQCRQELTIVDVCFAGQVQCFPKATVE